MTLLGRSRYAAALAALALVACGGGSGSSSSSPAPPTGGGGGGAPTPSPTPTPTPPPAFGFGASFAFVTPLGIEATVFDSQNISDPARVDALDARFLGASQGARISFERSSQQETMRVSFAEIDRAFVRTGSVGGPIRDYSGPANGERLRVGPLNPFFTNQPTETGEIAIVDYVGPEIGFTSGTRIGVARRRLFAVIGNPSLETGPIPVTKRFLVEGLITGSPGLFLSSAPGIVNISSDPNVSLFGVISIAFRLQENDQAQPVANLELRGTHDPMTNRLTGTIRNAAGQVVGTLEGGLYGPSRRRIGIVYEFTIPETGSRRHIGYVVGLEG